jgi:hypothetical protein
VAERGGGGDERAPAGVRADLDAAADGPESVAHILQPDTVMSPGHVEAGTVVVDLDVQPAVVGVQADRARRARLVRRA